MGINCAVAESSCVSSLKKEEPGQWMIETVGLHVSSDLPDGRASLNGKGISRVLITHHISLRNLSAELQNPDKQPRSVVNYAHPFQTD